MGQPPDVASPLVAGVNVKQTAVDHAGEALVPVAQRHGVLDQKLHGQATLAGLGATSADRFFHKVDAGDLVAQRGEEQRRVARPAPGIEHRTGNLIGDRYKRRLRPADFPRRVASVHLRKALKGR